MSQETIQWLNTQTLIGFTEQRGHAWHYRAEDQGEESNHYPQAIPVEDVLRRLFAFEVVQRQLFVAKASGMAASARAVPEYKAMVASDNGDVLGIFKDGYQPHQYPDWLVTNVANILDDTLGIGSAGLLRNRAQAWVSVEVPESITTPEGVEFRPNLLAATSFDGSMATTYKRVVQNVVCDNTLAVGLSEKGQVMKIRHTRNSGLKITQARQALAVVHQVADEFAAEVARLVAWKVPTREFDLLLDALVPVSEDKGRSQTLATNKQDALRRLYSNDVRCTPWKGTAWGVVQTFNTWAHHESSVKGGAHRGQRNMARALSGETAELDLRVLDVLAGVSGGGRSGA